MVVKKDLSIASLKYGHYLRAVANSFTFRKQYINVHPNHRCQNIAFPSVRKSRRDRERKQAAKCDVKKKNPSSGTLCSCISLQLLILSAIYMVFLEIISYRPRRQCKSFKSPTLNSKGFDYQSMFRRTNSYLYQLLLCLINEQGRRLSLRASYKFKPLKQSK